MIIPLAIPNLSGNERRYLNECVDTGFVSSVGAFVNRLESMACEVSGFSHAIAVSCGTTALHMALMESGVRAGDLVIVPSFTFIASANAIVHCDASPWFMDIDESSWTIDVCQLEQELTENCYRLHGQLFHRWTGQRVSAILAVLTLGNLVDVDLLAPVAQRFGLPVIVDGACALGATYKSRILGDCFDLCTVSLNGNKTFTAGGGGLVLTNDDQQAELIKHVSTTARVTPEYDFDMVGYNYRLTNLQAAVACAQLERFDEFVSKKREVRNCYQAAFADLPGISSFPVPSWCESSCWFSGFVVDGGDFATIQNISAQLRERGIESRSFWKPVHLQKPYAHALRSASLAVTEGLWNRILVLPCSTSITDEELDTVIRETKAVLLSQKCNKN